MEQIPRPSTQPQEFIFLLPLNFGTVYTQTERSAPGFGTTSKGRCAHVPFIFCAATSSAATASARFSIDLRRVVFDRRYTGV